jgi:mono/diheme cytochrome c family protein
MHPEMRLATSVLPIALAIVSAGCKKSEAATAQGPELFGSSCSRCHGASGGGGMPSFLGGPAPRNFQDHEFQLSRTDEQLKMTIVNGKGSGMPAFGKAFDDAQLSALVGQIRSFDPNKGGGGK